MISFSVQPETLATVLESLETKLSFLDDTRHYKAMIICEEALTNQFRHGDFKERPKEVQLTIDPLEKSEIRLRFTDNANPFDPLNFPDPDLTQGLDERTLGGLGIYMIKKYAHSLSYRYKAGKNVLEVVL